MKKKQYIIPQTTVTMLQTVSLMAQSITSSEVGGFGGKASDHLEEINGNGGADTNIDEWDIW